ncbi:MAG: hypothetical protein L0219_10510 [Phycisphaerales bacterium]|nr:hypothetical protein [Phycisphaerales bacterium]
MRLFKPDKTPLVFITSAICAIAAACSSTKSSSDGSDAAGKSLAAASQDSSKTGQPGGGDYFGEDWAAAADSRKKPADQKPGGTTSDASRSDDAASSSSIWTLVLATFTDANHVTDAQNMLAQLPVVAREVVGARIHTSAKGSMVIYGQYSGRDDEAAKADIERLKRITHQNRQVFSRVILTHLDLRLVQAQLHPHDLLSARRLHPKVDPLYTLDVAIWDDFDSGKISYDQIRRSAESYAAQLRAKGFEAYFYHDDANTRSIVTVGLFDRRAIHPTSGLYSQEVVDLISQFPARLANGEPVYEFKDKYRPKDGTKPQTPVLVLVPSM